MESGSQAHNGVEQKWAEQEHGARVTLLRRAIASGAFRGLSGVDQPSLELWVRQKWKEEVLQGWESGREQSRSKEPGVVLLPCRTKIRWSGSRTKRAGCMIGWAAISPI